jgi:hypothetical protein
MSHSSLSYLIEKYNVKTSLAGNRRIEAQPENLQAEKS